MGFNIDNTHIISLLHIIDYIIPHLVPNCKKILSNPQGGIAKIIGAFTQTTLLFYKKPAAVRDRWFSLLIHDILDHFAR